MAVSKEVLNGISWVPIFQDVIRPELHDENYQQYKPYLIKFAQLLGPGNWENWQIETFLSQLAFVGKDKYSHIYELLWSFCLFLLDASFLYENPLKPPVRNQIVENPSAKIYSDTRSTVNPLSSHNVANVIDEPQLTTEQKNVHLTLVEFPIGNRLNSMTPEELEINMGIYFDKRSTWGATLEDSSIGSYRGDLKQLISYMRHNKFNLDRGTLIKYVKHLKEHGNNGLPLASSSFSRKKAAIRGFLIYLENENLLMIKDLRDILLIRKREKTPQQKYKPLQLAQIVKVLKVLTEPDISTQTKLELLIPLICGPRPEETVNLRVSNFNLANNVLEVIDAKSGKLKSAPIPEFLLRLVKEHLATFKSDGDFIFPSRERSQISLRQYGNRINNLLIRAGVNPATNCSKSSDGKAIEKPAKTYKFTPHCLRSTFATNQYCYGNVQLVPLKQMMGHASVDITEGYIHCADTSRNVKLEDLYIEWELILYGLDKGINLTT